MNMLSQDSLMAYWSLPEVSLNIVLFMNIVGAMLLGLIVGYERSYHGRAAGMRTYALVCMASAALTVIGGYPDFWFGGHAVAPLNPDPTRVIQGIVTGIGFLGAGIIMKDGYQISGLTTAASIWASSAIGVLVGMGFYATAILLTLLSAAVMMGITKVEQWLPSHPAVAVTLRWRKGFVPRADVLCRVSLERGYKIALTTLIIQTRDGQPEWRFVAVATEKDNSTPIAKLAHELSSFEGVEDYQLSQARN